MGMTLSEGSAAAATVTKDVSVIEFHPCFNRGAHTKYGRIHLPVAPRCNVRCGYCVRKFDCVNESRPGVASVVLTPEAAMQRVRAVVERDGRLSVVGVAGPGDPLANDETLRALRLVHAEYPQVTLCLSTNGLLLPERVEELRRLGRLTLTVTVNAVRPGTAARIYRWARLDGVTLHGIDAGMLMVERQWEGLRRADEAGIVTKLNSVLIPGVNDAEIPLIAQRAAGLGVHVMNLTPLIPQGDFAGVMPPTPADIHAMRERCAPFLPLINHCRQCRSDACGMLGEDRDMETETLLARVGEEYCDTV
ncbi:MAG TPA: radical SAM protein [bacterium]